MVPLTVSPTTTCPDTFTSLHTQLSLSIHALLPRVLSCPSPCAIQRILLIRQGPFNLDVPLVPPDPPSGLYMSITARYKSYGLCTDRETLSIALLILDICPRHRGRRQHFSVEQTRQTSHSGTTLRGLQYNNEYNNCSHVIQHQKQGSILNT